MKSTGNAVAPGAWVPNSDGRLKDGVSRIGDPLSKMEVTGSFKPSGLFPPALQK